MDNSLPSPAQSPATTPQGSSSPLAGHGRKRARSSSSGASSSKRALSEDPSFVPSPPDRTRSPGRSMSDTSGPTSDAHGIDAYMADQGESDVAAMTIPGPPPPARSSESFASLTQTEKLSLISNLRKAPLVVGKIWYLVARHWYRRWEKACTGEEDKEGAVVEAELGPVDNSSLLEKDGSLYAQSLIEGVDVEFVPEAAWKLLVEWYGEPKHPLPRQVIPRGILKEPTIELRPPRIQVLRLVATDDSTTIDGSLPPKYVTISSQSGLVQLYAEAIAAISDSITKCRFWKVERQDLGGVHYPSSKLLQEGGQFLGGLLDTRNDTVEEALIESGDALVIETPVDDVWIVDESKVSSTGLSINNSEITTQAEQAPPLFASGTDFFSRLTPSTSGSSAKTASTSTVMQSALSTISTTSSNLKSAVNISSVSSALGKLKAGTGAGRNNHVPGTTGLGNLGNTCFMNSALQCLAHTQELTEYFLTGVYKEELNPENPLGMQGAIAEAFGALLHRLWSTTSPVSSYSPREFKQQLQRFAPQFSGYQQHDSQELVAFLLDGLHEDLNRVLKKPYVENPDWEGGGEKELVQLATKSWEGYMKRNDSVIVDLFQGQYRSTLVCPECQKVSITFDPFMYLTLPLPVQKKWKHNIFYIPWDVNKPHFKVPLEIGRNASFKELRQLLGRWMNAEPDNLLTVEVFSNRFYKNLDDTVLVNEMSDNDVIICFELPCHAQQSRTWKPDPNPENNPLILPVHLCKDLNQQRSSFQRSVNGFAHPFIVVLDPKQTKDRRQIYNAIVDRLQRWSVQPQDLFQWENDVQMEEVPISLVPKSVSVTEIQENGDVVTMAEEDLPEEGDIADEKSVIMQDVEDEPLDGEPVLKNLGPKPDLFQLHFQVGHEKYGTGQTWSSSGQRFEKWEGREDGTGAPLLREGDALFCEWDDNLRMYYFGDERGSEWAKWDTAHWEEFVHPEYKEAQAAATVKKNRGISLQDCLDEFTKEEQLGEDDLWYCPSCKKHQQATKKFDLWKVPDVLVVHLKRFSNSRTLRDKIDVFVDFPIEGLDLEALVGEREAAKRLTAQGVDIAELGLSDLDEPLVYDLYAVDEHQGGLGGGHYRAYAKNHETDKWYHFEDSYVTPARADDAVSANAYLLFYKRRTNRPIGGKTHEKVEAARQRTPAEDPAEKEPPQLPTPPEEEPMSKSRTYLNPLGQLPTNLTQTALSTMPGPVNEQEWPTPLTLAHTSPASSPPPLDEGDPPLFEDSHYDDIVEQPDALSLASERFDFPDPTYRLRTVSLQGSPSSSNEAEPDTDEPEDFLGNPIRSWRNQNYEWAGEEGRALPPSRLEQVSFGRRSIDNDYDVGHDWARDGDEERKADSVDPFEDSHGENVGKDSESEPVKEIPVGESSLLDIDL